MFLIDNILKLVIIFVGISLSVFFILLITFHVVEKQERAECRLWQEQANKYPDFFLTDWQEKQCNYLNMTISF